MFSPDKIKVTVEAALPGSQAHVTGDGDHFEVVVISSLFEGKRPVERHRMVYAAIGPAVGNEIHALAVKTLTPSESEQA